MFAGLGFINNSATGIIIHAQTNGIQICHPVTLKECQAPMYITNGDKYLKALICIFFNAYSKVKK